MTYQWRAVSKPVKLITFIQNRLKEAGSFAVYLQSCYDLEFLDETINKRQTNLVLVGIARNLFRRDFQKVTGVVTVEQAQELQFPRKKSQSNDVRFDSSSGKRHVFRWDRPVIDTGLRGKIG